MAEKGAEKSLDRGRGHVFGSSPKWLEQPHLELVHWWLLVHSSHPFDRSSALTDHGDVEQNQTWSVPFQIYPK